MRKHRHIRAKNRRWTPLEVRELMLNAADGIPHRVIGLDMLRTAKSVKCKAARLKKAVEAKLHLSSILGAARISGTDISSLVYGAR